VDETDKTLEVKQSMKQVLLIAACIKY